MSNVRYIISDASKKIDVEPHVLRYWEEELNLEIPRNEMGHRYYREQDISTLKAIKLLKEEGFQLRAIKMVLPDINKIEKLDPQSILALREELNEQVVSPDKAEGDVKAYNGTSIVSVERKSEVFNKSQENELNENTETREISEDMTDKMGEFKSILYSLIIDALKENNREFTGIVSSDVSTSVIKEMDYMMRMKEEREDERFKKFDEVVRGRQKSRKQVAAADSTLSKKKGGLFRKKK